MNKKLIEELSKLIGLNEEDKSLNHMNKEELRLELDGNPDSEDYWRTEPEFLDKIFEYIQKFDDSDFLVKYYDAEGSEENKTAVILDISNEYISGRATIYNKPDNIFRNILIDILPENSSNQEWTNATFYHLSNCFKALDEIIR